MNTNRTRQRRRVTYGVALAALAIALPTTAFLNSASADEAATELYMNPSGDPDNASGTADDPAGSLARIAEILDGNTSSEVTVHVDYGTYYETQEAVLDGGQTRVTFEPTSEKNPIFDGSDVGGYWLINRGPSVTVSGMTVIKYVTGGLRPDGTDGNRVSHMLFKYLGNEHASGEPGYGAIHTKDSSNNVIHNNQFLNLENVDDQDGWSNIHGVYLAEYSDDNQVYDNTFSEVSGDPVRLRNQVSNNAIHDNSFSNAGSNAMVSYWVMSGDSAEFECGSGNDVSSNNDSNGVSWHGDEIPLVMSGYADGEEPCDGAFE